jgi:hypothetical protein
MTDLDMALDYARVQGMSDAAIARAVKAEADRRRFADAPVDSVTLEHPGLPDQPITVIADAVVHWEAGGWKPAAPAPDAEQPPGDLVGDSADAVTEEPKTRARGKADKNEETL